MSHALFTSLLVTILTIYGVSRYSRRFKASRRKKAIPISEERVLVIGASSGVGREIALQYSHRGARVAIVGRNTDELERVLEECLAAAPFGGSEKGGSDVLEEQTLSGRDVGSQKFWGFTPIGSTKYEARYFSVVADCSDPKEAARVRQAVEESESILYDLNATCNTNNERLST